MKNHGGLSNNNINVNVNAITRLLVISDTHGDTRRAEEVLAGLHDIDTVIHLGDYFRDAVRMSAKFPGIPFEYVYGNCDSMLEYVDGEKLLEYQGVRIFITHGHLYSIKNGCHKLLERGRQVSAQVVLCGHTHKPEILEKYGCLLVNPGSIREPRSREGETYAILELSAGQAKASIVRVNDMQPRV